MSIFSLKPGSVSIQLIDKVDPNETLVGLHSFFPVMFSIGHSCSFFYVGCIVSKSTLVPAVCIGMNTVLSISIFYPFSLLYGLSHNGIPYARIWFGLISEWSNLVPYYSASFITMIYICPVTISSHAVAPLTIGTLFNEAISLS